MRESRAALVPLGPLRYRGAVLPAPWTVPIDPLLAVACATAAGLVAWCARHPRPGSRRWRRTCAGVALAVLLIAWVSPVQTLAAHYLLTAHLVQVLLVMGVVPPLLLLALPDAAPAAVSGRVRRVVRLLGSPIAGMVAINVVFFVWHLAPVYDAALHVPELYATGQLSLLAVSLMFWWPIVAPFGDRHGLTRWGTLGYIVVATIPQTFAGITVALAKHALYPTYAAAPRVLGLTVMADQQVAGACLALVSKLALFAAFAVVFMRMLNESPSDDSDDGGGGGRRPGADAPAPRPSGTLAWLADINAGRTVPEPAPPRRRVRQPAGAGPRPG